MKGRVLEALASDGVLLEPDAIDYLLGQNDPLTYAKTALSMMPQKPLILTLDDLVPNGVIEAFPDPPAPVIPRKETEVRILRDVTGLSCCEGDITDFARCFLDRFRKIKKMLVRRRELAGSISIEKAIKVSREVRFIAMVNEVRSTKNGHKMLEVEDEESRCLALITKSSDLINESIIPDEVIGIVGKTSAKGDMVIVEELIRPDIPLTKTLQPIDSSASVAFVSDIHVGSNTFLQKQWERMVSWLRSTWKEDGIEYMVISGDIVDGIGIFPNQEDELEIDDIFKQYERLSEFFKDIPDGIKLVVQPGNHDAVRPAEPQPTFSQKITDLFDSSIIFVGNPCLLEIEGRSILTYHGRSMDDLINNVQSLSYETPIEAMKEMLKRRHLSPMYGGKTPLAPEKEDYLVIDQVPDIFVTGHVHGAGLSEYRGVKLINASTWQAQTSFQRMHNFNPDPAKVPIIHLGTGRSTMMDFNS
ncbi:MAG: DNA-directed DNA polymerase II small subunit [Methanomassiliicoccales archaeon]|nr:DNA-directed DNA polymerase II small subunit [Methanomassiliicoccales archaeon]NYT15193.1 DNA-directed DNA polymerase II small subunit [Methanomassiliicoccales archaeon]